MSSHLKLTSSYKTLLSSQFCNEIVIEKFFDIFFKKISDIRRLKVNIDTYILEKNNYH